MSESMQTPGSKEAQQPFKVKKSNTIQFMRQTSLTKIGGLLNSAMNKNRTLQSQLSNPGEWSGVGRIKEFKYILIDN